MAIPCPAPMRLPDFAVPLDVKNIGVISRRDIRARPVFIYFYSGETPASVAMLSAVQQVYAKYHSMGLAVVAMQQSEAASLARPKQNDPNLVRKRFHLDFPIGRDGVGAERIFCVSELPTSLFYDRQGLLKQHETRILSFVELDRIVRSLLKGARSRR